MSEEFKFEPAVRERVAMLIGLAGPSGSGKTLTALLIARGLCGDDSKVFCIDTEQGRAKHYACAPGEKPGKYKFGFRYLSLGAPFSPERYGAAILAAEKAGAEVIIVDSMSHEHEGVGGVLESHEAKLTQMAGTDYGKRDAMKFAAWIEPKARHNKLVNTMLQRKPHLIFCFRAKEKTKIIRNQRGKMEPVNIGWTAICSDRFEYEMTMLLMLPPGSKGTPDLSQPHNKINQDHQALVEKYATAPRGLDEVFGKELAKWADGGATPAPKKEPETIAPPSNPPQENLAIGDSQDQFPPLPEVEETEAPSPFPPSDNLERPQGSLRFNGWPADGADEETWKAAARKALVEVRKLSNGDDVERWQDENWQGGLATLRSVSNDTYEKFGEQLAKHANKLSG